MDYNFLENTPQLSQGWRGALPIWQPDLSFLQSMDMKVNQQYEAGLSKIGNMYSIFNKPVTNPENRATQQQYAREVQNQMSDISSADLSNPKNVAIAENIMTPYVTDKDINYDISLTGYTNSQFQTAEGDKMSKDEKIRASYNPYSVNKLNWVLQDLKTAKRGDGSIQNVEKRSYVPQLDINEHLDAADKAEGFKGVDFETPDGKAGIIKEHDGIKAIPNYKTRIDALLDAKFNPQFSDQGYDWYRKEKAAVLRDNPGITEAAANQQLGQRRFEQLSKIYENKVVSLQNDIKAKFDDPVAMIMTAVNNNQGGKMTPEQQASIDKLSRQKQDYTGVVDRAQEDYNQFVKDPSKVIEDVQRNPEDYYARQVREMTINNMATGRAMGDYSYSLDVNKAWQAADQSANWKTNAGLRSQEIQAGYYKANLEHQDKHEKNLIDAGWTLSASGQLVPPASTTGTDMHYLGEDTANPQHTSFAQALQQEKGVSWNTAVDNTFSVNGVSGALLMDPKEGGIGLSLGTLTDFNTLYKRLYSNGTVDPNFKQTDAEKKAFVDVYNKLKGALGDEKLPYTYDGVRDALYTYVANQNAKRVATGTFTSTNDPLSNAFAASEISKDALNNYNSMNDQERQWIQHMAVGDKGKYKPLLNDQGSALATVSDIAKYAPTLEVTDKGNHKTINKEDYAQAFLQRNAVINTDGEISLDGGHKYMKVTHINGQPNYPDPYSSLTVLDHAIGNVIKRFGSYEDRDKLNNSLADNAASNLKFVKDKTGRIGGSFMYDFGSDKTPGRGEKLIAETKLPSNVLKWYDAKTGEDITADKDFKNQLDERTSSYNATRKNVGQPVHNTVSEYNAPTTTFTINAYTDEKGKVHDARTVVAVHSPDAKGDVIATSPQNSGVYVYQKLLRGESIISDDSSNGCGFKYELVPDNREHPTAVHVSITRTKYNPSTKQMEPYSYPIQTYPLSSGIDNLMAKVRAMQATSIRDLAAEQKQYNLQNAR